MRNTRIALLCIVCLAACSCATRSSLGPKAAYGPVKPASLSDYIRGIYKLSAESSSEAQRRDEALKSSPELADLVSRASQDPNNRQLRSELIDAYMDHALFKDAYELLMVSHFADSDDIETNLNLARIWDAWGQPEVALQYADRSISSGASSAWAYELLGRIHLHRNKPAEAIAWFERALQENHQSASILTNLGYASMLQADWQQARVHLESALKIDGAVPEAHNNLAVVLLRLGDEEGALSHLMATGVPAVAFNNMGALYQQINRLDDAQLSFKEALRLDPTYELARRNLQDIEMAAPPPSIIHISSLRSGKPNDPSQVIAEVATEPAQTNPLAERNPAPSGLKAAGVPMQSPALQNVISEAPALRSAQSAERELPGAETPTPKALKPSEKGATRFGEAFERAVRLEHRGWNIAGLAGAVILTGLFALRSRRSGL